MNILSSTVAASILIASSTLAQTQLVRGDVDGIQGTALFQLDATQIRLVSSTLNLQAMHNATQGTDSEWDMQVVQVPGATPTTLDVVSATMVPEMFCMGNLRLNQSATWEVFGAPGELTAVFLALRGATGYTPLGTAGTWVLGSGFGMLNVGVIAANGQFQFDFFMPDIPALVGTEISSQAVIVDASNTARITNPDSKDVRAN